MNGRQSKIVESAATCFLTRGFSETSLDDICAHSGVVKQTLYNNFDNKESLFKASMDHLILRTSIQPERAWLKLEPSEFLEKVGRLQLKTLQEGSTTEFLRLLVKECRRFPELQRVYAQHVPKPVVDFVSEFIDSSPYVSKAVRDASPELQSAFAWSFRASIVGYATLSNLGPLITNPLPAKTKYLSLSADTFAKLLSMKNGSNGNEVSTQKGQRPKRKGEASAEASSSAPISIEQLLSGSSTTQHKRQAILVGALRAFSSEGFADTSMDLVADLANASKQTVYKYFRSKNELYLELFKEVLTALQRGAGANDAESGGVADSSAFLWQFSRTLTRVLDTPLMREYFRVVLGESSAYPLQSGLLLRHILDHGRDAIRAYIVHTYPLLEADADALSVVLRSIIGAYALTRNIYVLDDNSYTSEAGLVAILHGLIEARLSGAAVAAD